MRRPARKAGCVPLRQRRRRVRQEAVLKHQLRERKRGRAGVGKSSFAAARRRWGFRCPRCPQWRSGTHFWRREINHGTHRCPQSFAARRVVHWLLRGRRRVLVLTAGMGGRHRSKRGQGAVIAHRQPGQQAQQHEGDAEKLRTRDVHSAYWILLPSRPFKPSLRKSPYSFTVFRRSALPITETELKLMAAPAMIGLRRSPKKG